MTNLSPAYLGVDRVRPDQVRSQAELGTLALIQNATLTFLEVQTFLCFFACFSSFFFFVFSTLFFSFSILFVPPFPRPPFPRTTLLPDRPSTGPPKFSLLVSLFGVFSLNCGRASRPWPTQIARLAPGGHPQPSGPPPFGPPLFGTPLFLGWGPHPPGPPFGAPSCLTVVHPRNRRKTTTNNNQMTSKINSNNN